MTTEALYYHFVKAGTVVCTRETLEEALEYGRRSYGWELYLGKPSRSYRVEEWRWDGQAWRLTGQEWNISEQEAVDPFPEGCRGGMRMIAF